MSVAKANPAGDDGSRSGSKGASSSSSSHVPSSLGRLSVDTGQLHRASASFKSARDRFYQYAAGLVGFAGHAPLVNGESDESWNQVAPSYFALGTDFLTGIRAVANAWGQLAESLDQYADYCEKTEASNTLLAKNALNLKREPESTVPATPRTVERGVAEHGLVSRRKVHLVSDGESVRPVGRDVERGVVEETVRPVGRDVERGVLRQGALIRPVQHPTET